MSGIARLMLSAAAGAIGLDVSEAFSVDLWSGNSSSRDIVNGVNVLDNGGLVWIKSTGPSYSRFHSLFDTERGAGYLLRSDLTNQSSFNASTLTAFNVDGFELNGFADVNETSKDYVGWTFRKAPKFFDIVTYTGDGTSSRAIAHDLGVAPGMVVVKRTDAVANWFVQHRGFGSSGGAPNYAFLNSSSAEIAGLSAVYPQAADGAEFFVGSSSNVNVSGASYVAYLFAHDAEADGAIQCGSYAGNGSSTGPTVDLGWEPQFAIIKRADGAGDWWMYDSARDTSNPRTAKLLANSDATEDTSGEDLDFTSEGFQPKATAAGINASGGQYIYMAIRAEGV